jgi:hypothetical protein
MRRSWRRFFAAAADYFLGCDLGFGTGQQAAGARGSSTVGGSGRGQQGARSA